MYPDGPPNGGLEDAGAELLLGNIDGLTVYICTY